MSGGCRPVSMRVDAAVPRTNRRARPLALALALLTAVASAAGDGDEILASRALAIPVEGVRPEALRDTFAQGRAGHLHEAIDIAAPRGTRVFASDDGTVVKLFRSIPGGLTIYQFDPSRRIAYYYAHLDRYADGVAEGKAVRRCDLIGYVGTTGNAPPNAPHLHFAVFRLGPEQRWWRGTALNPYPALRRAAAGAGPAPPCAANRGS